MAPDAGDFEIGIAVEEAEGMWHWRDGELWTVPAAGEYRVRVRVEPPTFLRHDHENGRRYLKPVEVEFDGVAIEPDQKTV